MSSSGSRTTCVDGAPDVIVGQSTSVIAALPQETRALPIVFVNVANPIASGFVMSFPRPVANVTGFTGFEPSLAGKWLELLRVRFKTSSRITGLSQHETNGREF